MPYLRKGIAAVDLKIIHKLVKQNRMAQVDSCHSRGSPAAISMAIQQHTGVSLPFVFQLPYCL